MGKPIYYMTAKVTFIKNKTPQTKSVWIVSKYDNPRDIMKLDSKTMHRLDGELLTPKAKQRSILIDKIESKKQVGTTCEPKQPR
tara:strand:+ start:2020 stop:2271 length:252 start_codon:yes stop_codon:yes gene_type:complete